jgi:hypothetical protein
MTRILLCGAAAVMLLAVPAAAQNSDSKTIDPVELSKQVKGPPAQLSDEQKNAIQNALVAEHSQQKTPASFQPQVGSELPQSLKVDAMPQDLIRAQPALKEYGYAKTAKDILVLDPLHKKIIAVIPRKFPSDAKAGSTSPADWADTKGRELTGQAPKAANKDHFSEPAGDAGDVKNGNDKSAQEKEDGDGKH